MSPRCSQAAVLVLVALLTVPLIGCGTASRVVRLDTGEGAPLVHRPRGGQEPVKLSRGEFTETLAELAREVRPSQRPQQAARQLFGVPERSGWYRYAGGSRPLLSAEEESHLPLELTPAEAEFNRQYLQWCANTWGAGDCLRLLVDGPVLAGEDRYVLAMAIAQGVVLREMKEALGEMVDPLAVMASIASAGTMYMLLWAIPEPVSKGVATTLTLGLCAYLGVDTVWRLIGGWLVLMKEVDRATTFDELHAAGAKYGQAIRILQRRRKDAGAGATPVERRRGNAHPVDRRRGETRQSAQKDVQNKKTQNRSHSHPTTSAEEQPLMEDSYYVGSYWLARPESAEACARRAETLFRLLGRHDPTWSHWHETADSFKEARKLRLATDASTLRRLFERKKNRIGDGFRYWLWAGDNPEETTAINGTCGFSGTRMTSTCICKPPSEGPAAERVLKAPTMTEVLRAMALAWEPEWGVATSHEHLDMASEDAEPGTFVGWVMYFSRERGSVPPLPAPVRIEPVEDKGTLIILTPERFTAANPEHVALAARVHELLDEAGLLRPLQPMTSS